MNEYIRKKTRKIYYGSVGVGGDSAITVQSMTNTDTRDVHKTINQIKELEKARCDIIRVAVPNLEAAEAVKHIKKSINIPLIADIHFDYRLALESVKNGVDGLRINPGNIGSIDKVKEVVKACKERKIPIRIGVNSGSISKAYLEKFGGVNVKSMVESALEHINTLRDMDYHDMVISLKATDVYTTVNAYKSISEIVDYPLHIGITEAGTQWAGTIKSSIGIGSILLMGIGDTIRVSLTGEPLEEVKVGKQILRSIGMLRDKIEIISCPTCGRTEIDLISLAKEVEKRVENIDKPIKIAIMGCIVNGPGEAREADLGIAGGRGNGIIFKKGKVLKKVKEGKLIDEFMKEINKL